MCLYVCVCVCLLQYHTPAPSSLLFTHCHAHTCTILTVVSAACFERLWRGALRRFGCCGGGSCVGSGVDCVATTVCGCPIDLHATKCIRVHACERVDLRPFGSSCVVPVWVPGLLRWWSTAGVAAGLCVCVCVKRV